MQTFWVLEYISGVGKVWVLPITQHLEGFTWSTQHLMGTTWTPNTRRPPCHGGLFMPRRWAEMCRFFGGAKKGKNTSSVKSHGFRWPMALLLTHVPLQKRSTALAHPPMARGLCQGRRSFVGDVQMFKGFPCSGHSWGKALEWVEHMQACIPESV